MTYGSAEGVAAFVPRFANASGRFDNTTVPTLAQLEDWLSQVSAALDVAMSTSALPAPATAPAVLAMLDGFVNSHVAGMARGVNGQGRFSEKPTTADEMLLLISDAADAWVLRRAAGIAALSGVVPETTSETVSLAGSRLPVRRVDDTDEPPRGEYVL